MLVTCNVNIADMENCMMVMILVRARCCPLNKHILYWNIYMPIGSNQILIAKKLTSVFMVVSLCSIWILFVGLSVGS